MGQDKATMDFVGAPMISWCAAALAQSARSLVVVSATEAHAMRCARAVEGAWPRFTVLRGFDIATAIDAAEGQGPLGGFAAGLAVARTEFVAVSACDTPLVPAEFYRRAAQEIGDHDAVVPSLEAPEPLISLWRRESALARAKPLAAEGRGPRALAEALRVRFVGAEELAAWGIDRGRLKSANTPEAAAALATLARAAP